MLADYEAAIDRIESALRACPEERWTAPCWAVRRTDAWMPKALSDDELQVFSAFWGVAGHAVFYLDFYLDDGTGGFAPAHPRFDAGLDDQMQARMPNPALTREELLAALADGRAKAQRVLPSVTDEQLALRMPTWHPWAGTTFADLLKVNVEHLREHGAHLEAVVRA